MVKIEDHLTFVTRTIVGEIEEDNHISVTFPNTFHQTDFRLWGYDYAESVILPLISGLAMELYRVRDPDPVFQAGRDASGNLVEDLELSIVDLGLIVSIDIGEGQGVIVVFQTTIDDCGLKNEIQSSIEQAVKKFAIETLKIAPEDIDKGTYAIEVYCQSPSNWSTDRAVEFLRHTVFKEGFLQTLQEAQFTS